MSGKEAMEDVAFEPLANEVKEFEVILRGAVDADFESKYSRQISEIIRRRNSSDARRTKVDLRAVTHFGAPGIRLLDRLAQKRAVTVLVKSNSFGDHIVELLKKASTNKNRLVIDREILAPNEI